MIVKLLFTFFCFFAALKCDVQDRKAFPTALKHDAQDKNCAAGFFLREGPRGPYYCPLRQASAKSTISGREETRESA